jgi:hypothetical protein
VAISAGVTAMNENLEKNVTKSVVDTGGLFAADVADTVGQLPAGVNSMVVHLKLQLSKFV